MGRTHVEILGLWLVQLVPGVGSDLANGDAVFGVGDEDLGNHILGFGREEVREVELGVEYFFVEFGGLLVFVGEVATEHGVEDHSATPEVTHQTMVLLPSDHLQELIGPILTSGAA